jgi:integrase
MKRKREMSKKLSVIPNKPTTLALTVRPTVNSVYDTLLDQRSLLENELTLLLTADTSTFNAERAEQLITELLNEFEDSERDGVKNTWKTIVSNWRIFFEWCNSNNHNALPASVPTFMAFLNDKAPQYKANSLHIYRWAVNTIHSAAGLPSPTVAAVVKKRVKSIKESKARNAETAAQAPAFKWVHLEALIALWGSSARLIELRDLAIITVAYETLLRESELARIAFEHIEHTEDGRAVLTIPFTKTNQSGEVDVTMLSNEAVGIIDRYVRMAGLDEAGLLFRQIYKSGSVTVKNAASAALKEPKPLSGYAIDKIFAKAYAALKAHDYTLVRKTNSWSGHSARVGACQDLLAAGYSALEVQQSGRWSSIDMVYRYGRSILAKEGAMARAREGALSNNRGRK